MKCLQLVLHLSVVLFHQCQVFSFEQKCQVFMNGDEGRVQCDEASDKQLTEEFRMLVGGVNATIDLSIRNSDVSALPLFPKVLKLQLDDVRLGATSLSQSLSKFPKLQLLMLDNSKEKITLTRETFMPGQPILTLIFNNNELTDADIDSDAFENIKSTLKALALRENRLTHLPAAVTGLTDLRDLDFTGNPIKYFSEETTKQLKSLQQLQTMNINDLDCQCHQLWESFPIFLKEKRIRGVTCSQQSKFPGSEVSEIDVEAKCEKPKSPTPTPGGSGQIKAAFLALISTILPLFLM